MMRSLGVHMVEADGPGKEEPSTIIVGMAILASAFVEVKHNCSPSLLFPGAVASGNPQSYSVDKC